MILDNRHMNVDFEQVKILGEYVTRCILSSSSLLPPSCRVFTIIHLKPTVFLRYIVFQLFCITICATCNVFWPVKYVLYSYISTFHSMCAVPNMAVFCSSLISCFPDMLLRYCLSDFEMVPVTPFVTGITFAFTFHMHWISIIRSLYFKIFSLSWSYFCLKKLQHLLTCMFLSYYHELCCLVFC